MRSDSSDSAFEFLGGFWGTDIEQFGGPGFEAGKTEFKLKINPNGDAHFFKVCMGEGFVKLIGSDQYVRRFGLCTAPDGELHCGVCDRPGRQLRPLCPHARVRGLSIRGRSGCGRRILPCGSGGTGSRSPGIPHSALRRPDRPDRSEQRHEQWQLRYRIELRKWAATRFRLFPNYGWLPGFRARAQYQRTDVRAIRSFRHQRRSDSLLLPRRQSASDLQLTRRLISA